jgi:putative transposase
MPVPADAIRHHVPPSNEFTVTRMCVLVAMLRRTHDRLVSHPLPEDAPRQLRNQLQRIGLEWPSDGYRCITYRVARRGVMANHKRVLWMMRTDSHGYEATSDAL